jgi:hypothetical protein
LPFFPVDRRLFKLCGGSSPPSDTKNYVAYAMSKCAVHHMTTTIVAVNARLLKIKQSAARARYLLPQVYSLSSTSRLTLTKSCPYCVICRTKPLFDMQLPADGPTGCALVLRTMSRKSA